VFIIQVSCRVVCGTPNRDNMATNAALEMLLTPPIFESVEFSTVVPYPGGTDPTTEIGCVVNDVVFDALEPHSIIGFRGLSRGGGKRRYRVSHEVK
jgi:hypothetical protein